MLKKENGITLVALVITIIVLLILAGITLSLVLGDSGLFGKARNAETAMKIADAKDKIVMAIADAQADVYATNTAYADAAAAITAVNTSLGSDYSIDSSSGKVSTGATYNSDNDVKNKSNATLTVTIALDTNDSKIITYSFSNDTL